MQGVLRQAQTELSVWLNDIITVGTSWWALRLYVAAAALLFLALSFWIAQRQRRWLLSLEPGNFDRSFSGPRPSRKQSILKQLDRLHAFKRTKIFSALGSLVLLIVFGFVVPSLLIGLGIVYFRWFNPAGHLLIDEGSHPLNMPSPWQTFWFLISQVSLGVAGSPESVAGSFGAHIANISFDHGNPISVIAVLAYRYFVGAFGGVFGHFTWTLGRVFTSTGPKEEELNAALGAVASSRDG